MLGTMLMIMSHIPNGGGGSPPPETTPEFTSGPSAAIQFDGFCSGGSVSFPSRTNISWTASNFNASLHDYKVYKDGILVSTQSTSPYTHQVDGFITNGFFHPTFKSWTFRVDIVRKSDSAVLATGSVVWSAYYYLCS